MPSSRSPERTLQARQIALAITEAAVRTAMSERTALTLLTVYVALLWGIPSSQSIGLLGSLGAPSMLWGLLCLVYWAWTRMSSPAGATRAPLEPVRIAYLALLVVVWLSFSFAQARGLTPDESSPSVSALIRTLSWAGVLLLANDAIRDWAQLRTLARRMTLFAGLFAALGLAQFVTGQAFVDAIHLPGLSMNPEMVGVMGRSGFVRSGATATHPLEYAVVLSAMFPIAVAIAMTARDHGLLRRTWAAAFIGVACLLSVSRSAIIGFAVGLILLVPALSWRGRRLVSAGLAGALVLIYVAVPGMLGSIIGLFQLGDDSTASRTSGLAVTAEIAGHQLVIGRGFGTFLPKYYILDNALALLLIEVGVLGLLAFLGLTAAAVVQAWRARRASQDPDRALLAQGLLAGTAGAFSLFAFFDAFSFGMAAGTFLLMVGLCGGAARVARMPDRPRSRAGPPTGEAPARHLGSPTTRRAELASIRPSDRS